MVDMSSPAVIAWWSGGSENRLDGQIVRLKIERMDRQIDGQIDIDDSLLLYLFFVFVFCTTCSRSLNIWVQLIYLSILFTIILSISTFIYLLIYQSTCCWRLTIWSLSPLISSSCFLLLTANFRYSMAPFLKGEFTNFHQGLSWRIVLMKGTHNKISALQGQANSVK